ncbi:MAG: TrkH family potassium uptake protein [Candidatus Omnitrophota bacterium]
MAGTLRPPQIVALSFFVVILAGAALLYMPFSVNDGSRISLIDSVFTATSAVCVTGLVVKDTGAFFSFAGKAVMLTLIQIGGLGIMTFSTLFAIIMGRKLTLKDNIVIQKALNQQRIEGLRHLIKYILLITFSVELLGAACFFLRWVFVYKAPPAEAFISSVFHSVSAFCNAGFSLFGNSFTAYAGDPYINLIMITLIFFGGIGFLVIHELPKCFMLRSPVRHISVQTKMALSVSLTLIVLGSLFILLLENNNAFSGMPVKDKLLASVFQSVTTRTAGFNTVDINGLLRPTLMGMMFLMFIGASPGSTGGGIKTCTFGVLLAGMASIISRRGEVTAFRRTIPAEVMNRALAIVFIAASWIFFATMVLLITEREYLTHVKDGFMRVLFEVTSAFGTVGLSTGITPYLSIPGKILISITMFVGRVGPLTVALSVALDNAKPVFKYPEERIMVG